MTFLEILSTLLLGPLKLIFEYIFAFAYNLTCHVGLSVIALSVMVNCLLLPLYRRTDLIQEAARDTEERLREGADHIKKTFSGDERMMILQTYYRQNHYKPASALNGSVSLLLEVPFFMAAYQFLSGLSLFDGVSFGPIQDMSVPDAMIVLGGLTINALPVLMTVINLISSAIYMKGFPLKSKLQLYAMALFFLVFLYQSPSGLVLYWTMNNLFSLGKTLFYKLKNPGKVAIAGAFAIGMMLAYFALFVYDGGSTKAKALLIVMGVLLQMPQIVTLLAKKFHWQLKKEAMPNRRMFTLCGLFLTILTGLLIPTTFIAASPQEFVDITYYYNPLWYMVASTCLAAGAFLVWLNVFYWLANDTGKAIFDKLACILCGIMTVNYMFFGTDLGIIGANLQYESGMYFTRAEQIVNILVIFAVAGLLYWIITKYSKITTTVLLSAAIALGGMSAVNIMKINDSLDDLEKLDTARNDAMPCFELSTTGNNVVVIMLDRALGEYVPYLIQERPELEEQFEGFTYYANTVSFGGSTNFATPALFGGYEYTPVELNKRDTETLASKQNEALKVMPVTFLNNGYNVTVCDPPYANYHWQPDLSIYDDYPEINTYITKGKFGDKDLKIAVIENNHRNFFCFSIMKTMPVLIQPLIYNNGIYHQLDSAFSAKQVQYGLSASEGVSASFMESFGVLMNLSEMTNVTDSDQNTFMFLMNETTHEPMLLQTPDYEPAQVVNNTAYDAQNVDRFTVNEKTIRMENTTQMTHYHTNMAVLIQLGEWFDYLKENGVYDNTRIILVSDHGKSLESIDEMMIHDDMGKVHNVESFYPLLMVKDFNSQGFTTSDAFMTNADVPILAMDQLIENPVNPFTGKELTNDEKFAHDQIIILSREWDITTNNGNTFHSSRWASVKDNIWEKSNWSFSDDSVVLTEHALP